MPDTATFPEDVMVEVFQGALSTRNICSLARVSKRWRGFTRNRECWAGKEIRLSLLGADQRDLNVWWPAWSKASRVFLTLSQMGGTPLRCLAPCSIEHPWGRWDACTTENWHRISLGGHAFHACMTRDEAPERVEAFQDVSHGYRFSQGVWVGVTTAASPDMLSRLSSQTHDRASLPFCDVLAVEIFPRDYGGPPTPAALYTSTRAFPNTGVNLPYSENLFFDHDAAALTCLRFDRVAENIQVSSSSGSVEIPLALLASQGALVGSSPARFFLATLCTGAVAPAVSLLPTRRD